MAIQSQPLNQAWIWTVDVTPYRSFGDRNIQKEKKQMQQESRFRDMRYRDSIAAIESRMNLDR
jgi:hypothetical protein